MRPRRPGTLWALGVGVLAAALSAPTAHATLAYTSWSSLRAPRPAVWVAHDDGSAPRRLVAGSGPHVSPDGRLVEYDASGLRVLAAAGGRSRILARDARFLAWSPDSRAIAAAVIVPHAERERLVTIDVASGATRTIATAFAFVGASYSPHGDALAYGLATLSGSGASRHSIVDVYATRLSGGRPARLTRDHRSSQPLWGRLWIVYVHTRDVRNDTTKYDLYAVKPSGAQGHQLTHQRPGRGLAGLRPIAWSANGHRLVAEFVGDGADYAETVSAFTGAVRRVGKPAGGERGAGIFPTGISRDGTRILGSTGALDFDGDAVTIPYHGGRPRLLARHAIEPSWSR